LEQEENKKVEEVVEDTNNATKEQKEIEELNERYKRLYAEFDNFKKRSSKEKETLRLDITGDIASAILPVIDNMEKAAKAATADEAYKNGVLMVLKQLNDVLLSFGVEEIKTVGETFDPEVHEAVSRIEDDTKGEKEVVEEFRKGYKIGTKVIRHSMVIVAN